MAIKVIDARLTFTPGLADWFLLVARIAAQWQQQIIIVVHQVRQDEDLIFFVMRLVEGGSRDDMSTTRAVPPAITVSQNDVLTLRTTSLAAGDVGNYVLFITFGP